MVSNITAMKNSATSRHFTTLLGPDTRDAVACGKLHIAPFALSGL
jgi:hypothetical protein